MNPNSGPPPEQDVPLQVPKKTKLYVEQVMGAGDVTQLFVLNSSFTRTLTH